MFLIARAGSSRLLHTMLLEVVPNLISLFLKSLSWGFPSMIGSGTSTSIATRFTLDLLLFDMLDCVWYLLRLLLLFLTVQRMNSSCYCTITSYSKEIGLRRWRILPSASPSDLLSYKAVLDDLLYAFLLPVPVKLRWMQYSNLVRFWLKLVLHVLEIWIQNTLI